MLALFVDDAGLHALHHVFVGAWALCVCMFLLIADLRALVVDMRVLYVGSAYGVAMRG